jgi:lysozyme family protein
MTATYQNLKGEYERLLASVKITNPTGATAAAKTVFENGNRYIAAGKATGVPWPLIGVLDLRESDCDPAKALGQGDPWNRVSVNVPRGKGPFKSWEDAAKYYIHYDGLDDPPAPYDMTVTCYMGEKWNGFGPRNRGINTGYLWSFTNHYTGGKYVSDGVWNAGAFDKQPGIIAVLLKMFEIDPAIKIGSIIVPSDEHFPIVPLPAPYDEKGTRWIQSRLNILMVANNDKPDTLNLLDVDGNYGRQTAATVKDFQRWQSIAVDGEAGDETLKAMDNELLILKGKLP